MNVYSITAYENFSLVKTVQNLFQVCKYPPLIQKHLEIPAKWPSLVCEMDSSWRTLYSVLP